MRGREPHIRARAANRTERAYAPVPCGVARVIASVAGTEVPRLGRCSAVRAFRNLAIAAFLGVWIGCGAAQQDAPRRMDPRGANLLGEAQQAYIGGDLGRAAVLIDSAEMYIPDAADLWFLRGRVQADLYRFEASDSAFRKVLAVDPDYRNARFAMGHNAFLQSTYHAKDAYRAALRYYTEEAELLHRLAGGDRGGEARGATGLVEGTAATGHAGKATDAAGHPEEATAHAAEAPTATGRTDAARPARAPGSSPRTTQAQHEKDRDALTTVLLQIGTTYHKLNRPDSALLYYRRALDADPALARGYAWIGGIEQSLGRFENALANAQRATSLEPENPEYALLVGVILNDLGRYDEAVPYLTRAARELPTNRTAVHSLGTAMVATGAQEEGAVYLARGDSMELLRAQIEQAHMGIFHDPQDPIRWENYAFLLHQAGQVAEARRAIQVMRQVSAAPPAAMPGAAPESAGSGSTTSPEKSASK